MKNILLYIGLGSILFADFSRSTDGIITDNITQLIWQDNYRDQENRIIPLFTWEEALNYCEQLTLGGNDNWRLPNKNELFSITYFGRYKPAISPLFLRTNESHYWSSSTRASINFHAWTINFINGSTHIRNKTAPLSVRCVRSEL